VRLRWSRPALRDLSDIRAYIAADNPTAAVAITARIRRTGERVRDFPESGERVPVAALRVTSVPGTPYRLIYRIEGDTVVVAGVWHGARQWPFD
jgi:addiction module RelE/StbE family toxin